MPEHSYSKYNTERPKPPPMPPSPKPKKGSWEYVFGHLGTPEEVAQEWCRMQDELNAYKLKEVANRIQDYGSPAAHRNAVIAELRPHVGKICTSCGVGSMYIDTNGYTYFLRCHHCQNVPLMKHSYGTQ